MYKTYDKVSAIKELQRLLAGIYLSETYIAPSGIYDETTRNSVIRFQRENALPSNGIVDKTTFDLIYLAYSKKDIVDNSPKNISFPINVGDYGEEIKEVNIMIISVMDNLGLYHNVKENSMYSISSKSAQSELSNVFGITDMGFDELFYDRLKSEFDLLINTQEIE